MANRKILVVDDERHIVKLVRVNLERVGYQVVTANDGVEALEQVKAEEPDLVILDIRMPRKDGWQVIKEMQGKPATQNIPIIVLSQLAEDRDIFKGWASGVNAYLTKPFNPQEILAFVKRIFHVQDEPEEAGSAWLS